MYGKWIMYEMSNGITFFLVKSDWHTEKQTLTLARASHTQKNKNNPFLMSESTEKNEKSFFSYCVAVRNVKWFFLLSCTICLLSFKSNYIKNGLNIEILISIFLISTPFSHFYLSSKWNHPSSIHPFVLADILSHKRPIPKWTSDS